MRRAFYIFLGIFSVSLFVLVFYAFTQSSFFSPDEIANSPFPGFTGFVSALERISGIDAMVSFVSGLLTIVTGILKRWFE